MNELPDEVIVKILQKLSAKDLCIMKNVNSRFLNVAEDSLVWKSIVKRDYRPKNCFPLYVGEALIRREIEAENKNSKPVLESWCDVYKRQKIWVWDQKYRYPWIHLSNNGHTATHVGSGYYHVVRCAKGVGEGIHYFEVLINVRQDLSERDRLRLSNHTRSIGFCTGGIDFSLRNLAGWGGSENGVGWYANGNVHPCYPCKAMSYTPGDVLGLLLCNKIGEIPYICLYKNGKQASSERYYIHVSVPAHKRAGGEHAKNILSPPTFYLHCFLSGGDEASIVYVGEKLSCINDY